MVRTDSPRRVADVLERLEVPRQRVLYVQSSVDWIRRAGFEISDVLPTLTDWIGAAGTLVMPTYPFLVPHREYLAARPIYDVRRTPARTGLLSEAFRRTSGVRRSLDPDFCVAAAGADASAVVGGVPLEADPFGAGSCYQRMLDRDAVFVGLGVSLNTISFMHLIDSRAESGYPAPVYEDELGEATVLDDEGRRHLVSRRVLRPELQQLTNPQAIVDAMTPERGVFDTVEIDGARFFRWNLDRWAAWCVDHAAREAARCQWPCWLKRLG